ncbi:uncharacterized protein LOC131694116 [Topomyia yanbarensis]|uniref:uncharacterized protein LOC131694116 n=1 Tax=Topomyia yanbarensis TaxID=2498891 RepID=UPI00273C5F2E|nr:uncharacterized protein LOC131694116 [Topomyia yanbarensis]
MAKAIPVVVGLLGLLAFTATRTDAIRVYWNTNTGPIVPPTSTPAPVPKPPFRDPAPVWENQSDDVPNPNPYVYILPPPSRPKYNDITLEHRRQNRHESTTKQAVTTSSSSSTPTPPTGRIIEKPEQNNSTPKPEPTSPNSQPQSPNNATPSTTSQPQTSHRVPSLAIQYVPNQGFKYYAVVPVHNEEQSKSAFLKTNDAMLGKYDRYDKPNGRYNAKLKKYKAYEKVKYVPYYAYFDAQKQQYILSSISPKAVNNQL